MRNKNKNIIGIDNILIKFNHNFYDDFFYEKRLCFLSDPERIAQLETQLAEAQSGRETNSDWVINSISQWIFYNTRKLVPDLFLWNQTILKDEKIKTKSFNDWKEIEKVRNQLKNNKKQYSKENPWIISKSLNTVVWKPVWFWINTIKKTANLGVKWVKWTPSFIWNIVKSVWKVATSPAWLTYRGIQWIWKIIPPINWIANAWISAERWAVNIAKFLPQIWWKFPNILWWWIWRFLEEKMREYLKIDYMDSWEIWTAKWATRWLNRWIWAERTAVDIAQSPIWILRRIPWFKWTWKANDWLDKLKIPQLDPNSSWNLIKSSDFWKDVWSILSWEASNDWSIKKAENKKAA